jgi:hypothetical protein
LRWASERKASYYRVQIFRATGETGNAKPTLLFEVWTTEPRLHVAATWIDAGRLRRLDPGLYRWMVFVVGTGTTHSPVANGSFSL